jgi:hypothetical protein
MHHAPGLTGWAGLPLEASPWWVLIVVVLLWSVVSVLLVAGPRGLGRDEAVLARTALIGSGSDIPGCGA